MNFMMNGKDIKYKLLGKTPEELKEIAVKCGLPSYAGGQIAQWLYKKKVKSIDEMTNLSKAGRDVLRNLMKQVPWHIQSAWSRWTAPRSTFSP